MHHGKYSWVTTLCSSKVPAFVCDPLQPDQYPCSRSSGRFYCPAIAPAVQGYTQAAGRFNQGFSISEATGITGGIVKDSSIAGREMRGWLQTMTTWDV